MRHALLGLFHRHRWSLMAPQAAPSAPDGGLCLEIAGGRLRPPGLTRRDQGPQLNLSNDWVVWPGLINAHDHLEMNSFPLLGKNRPYGNFYEWADDVKTRWDVAPLPEARRVRWADRLRLGGLKNLLNGVTLVCQHGSFPRALRSSFPVPVLSRFRCVQSVESVWPSGLRFARFGRRPLLVHMADGVDDRARAEFEKLEEVLPLNRRMVLVHCLGLSATQIQRAAARGCRFVWCPVSNQYLYDACAPVEALLGSMTSAMGSDSAVSGSAGLLDDLRHAAALRRVSAQRLCALVTGEAARMLGLERRIGSLNTACRADLLVVPRTSGEWTQSLLALQRRDVGLVVIAGRPVYGDRCFQPLFDDLRIEVRRISVDGRDKLLDASLEVPWAALERVRAWTPLWQGVNG